MSIKALAERVLQGNQQGNRKETESFLIPEQGKPESFQVSLPMEVNQETPPADLHRMVGEALAEVDRLGRPWPARYLVDMPAEDRERLREIERHIDQAVLSGDAWGVAGPLDAWRAQLMMHLH